MWDTVFDKIELDFHFKKAQYSGQKCEMLLLIELMFDIISLKLIEFQ